MTFKNQTNISPNSEYDNSIYLRAMGYSNDTDVAIAEFLDKNGNAWKLEFRSQGLQLAEIEKLENENEEKAIKILECAKKYNFKKGLTINQLLEEVEDEINMENLSEDGINILKCIEKEDLICWHNNCWIEPVITITSNKGKVLISTYESNLLEGNGVYESLGDIERTTSESYVKYYNDKYFNIFN